MRAYEDLRLQYRSSVSIDWAISLSEKCSLAELVAIDNHVTLSGPVGDNAIADVYAIALAVYTCQVQSCASTAIHRERETAEP